ncbi:hypothetical protein DRO66_02520 [Candidatus Bathyarchaeota archaeon]|nr:MAG: hypothetical protein DRO66_02520 [Candidatus Bathyarchaeota archaeon]
MDFLDDRIRIIVLEWNKDDADEVERAEKTFTTYLKKGWIAFAVTPEEKRIHVFQCYSTVEKIILAPVVEGG